MNMQNLIQVISNPPILRTIDRYLLLNKPFLWSSRVHYVFYYGLLINLVLILLTLILIQPHQIDELTQFILPFLVIFEICAFFFWMFRQSIFNLEQDYGKQRNFFRRSALEIITYLFCILIVFSPSVLIPLCAIHKIAYQIKIDNRWCYLYASLIIHKTLIQSPPERIKPFFSSYEFKEITTSLNQSNVSIFEIDNIEKYIARCLYIKHIVYGLDLDNKYPDPNYKYLDDISHPYFDINYENEANQQVPYEIYLFLQTCFISTIGIPILIIQKYGNWRLVALTGFYIVIITVFITPVLIILNTLNIYIPDFSLWGINFSGINGNFFLIITAITALIVFYSLIIFNKKSYNWVLFINWGVISILLNSLLLSILIDHEDYLHMGHLLLPFIVVLVLYCCLFPIQKKMLLRNLSLPKPD